MESAPSSCGVPLVDGSICSRKRGHGCPPGIDGGHASDWEMRQQLDAYDIDLANEKTAIEQGELFVSTVAIGERTDRRRRHWDVTARHKYGTIEEFLKSVT